MPREKNDLLADLRARKQATTLSFALKVLRAFGFSHRKTKRNHTVLTRDNLTLILPQPSDEKKDLKLQYVNRLIAILEESEAKEPAGH